MNKKRGLAFGVVGTLVAAGVGYLAGLMTAPKSGKETRQEVGLAVKKAKHDAEHKLKAAHKELNDIIEEVTVFTQKSKDKASEEITKAKKSAELVRQKTREILSAVHEGEADDEDLNQAISEVKKAAQSLKKFVKS